MACVGLLGLKSEALMTTWHSTYKQRENFGPKYLTLSSKKERQNELTAKEFVTDRP